MAIGVFGKLPAKRDFVQKDMPRELMDLLDPWLQSALQEQTPPELPGQLPRSLS